MLRIHLEQEQVAQARRLVAEGYIMQMKGTAKIRSFVDRLDPDGHEVPLRPGQRYTDEMTVGDAIRLVKAGVELELLGRGLDPRSAREPEPAPLEIPNPIVQALTAHPWKTPRAVEIIGELLALLDAEPGTGIGA
jgi:hypothetical protein